MISLLSISWLPTFLSKIFLLIFLVIITSYSWWMFCVCVTKWLLSRSFITDIFVALLISLAAIARKRPLHYSSILPTLLGFDPNFETLKGGHPASIQYAIRTAFLGFLRCTHPAIIEVCFYSHEDFSAAMLLFLVFKLWKLTVTWRWMSASSIPKCWVYSQAIGVQQMNRVPNIANTEEEDSVE